MQIENKILNWTLDFMFGLGIVWNIKHSIEPLLAEHEVNG